MTTPSEDPSRGRRSGRPPATAVIPRRSAAVFLGSLAGKRAVCRLGLMDPAGGRREAESALALWPDNSDARYTLAVLLASEGRYEGALAQLDTVLAKFPFDESATILRDSLREEGRGPRGR